MPLESPQRVHQGGFVIFSHMVLQFLIFFLSFFLLVHNCRPNQTSSWQPQVKLIGKRASMSFTSTPLGFKPTRPFSRSEGPRMGYITSERSSPVGSSFIFLVIPDSVRINIDFEGKLDFHTNTYRIDRPVSEQLRTQTGSNCHTLFLWF